MSWTPERIGELEKLWAEGLSTAEIGRRIGVSKNAVVGKAHRLGLPGRQSPIESKRLKQTPRSAAPEAQPQEAVAQKAKPEAPKKPDAKPAVAAEPPRKAAARAAAPKQAAKKHSGPSCQWPFGDPRLPGFHFCGAPAVSGKPYCGEHCAAAYNLVSSSQAEARAKQAVAAA